MKILVLVAHWDDGFGVARVARAQVERLAARGHEVVIGCFSRRMAAPPSVPVVQIPWKAWGLRTFLEQGGWDHVIAHTQEFMEAIAGCSGPVRIIYDHGEPPPEYFPAERAAREAIIRRRREHLAPSVDHVICISEFEKRSLGHDAAVVLHNGADHREHRMPATGESPRTAPPWHLLCISRMWAGEREYKGLGDLVPLAAALRPGWVTTLAGRGSEDDRSFFEEVGLQVVLNPSDEELERRIRECDALVSLSRWEGFNLPLVEAGIVGKPAYALDWGAHREVVPYVFSTIEELAGHLRAATRASLDADGASTREFVSRFRWDRNVDQLERSLLDWKRPGTGVKRRAWCVWPVLLGWKLWKVARRLVLRQG